MGPHAAYDDIADWYEHEFLATTRHLAAHPLGIDRLIDDLLGPGHGTCVEIGCGTGEWAARVGRTGRRPLGVDLSAAMLGHARGRLPVVRADAAHLPFGDASVSAAITVMAHTDMPHYPDVLREVARILRPGGRFVHIGVHPCFCGGFADRSDPDAVVVRRGYLDSSWTTDSWTDQGVRNRVGATHWPLAPLLDAFLDAGLVLDRFAEGGTPTPTVLGLRAHVPHQPTTSGAGIER